MSRIEKLFSQESVWNCEFYVLLCIKLLSTFSSWKDDIIEKRILGSILWRAQNVWHGYSKKVACEKKHETMKVYDISKKK
jgi:hypothetical protein